MNSKEIAKLAGVSRSTVSRVINNYSNVPEETRRKVLEIIEKYDYTPNSSARNLAGKSNRIIGLFFIEESKWNGDTIHSSPFYSEFLSYCADKLLQNQYHLLISVVKDSKEKKNIKSLFDQKLISGAIIMGDELEDYIIDDLTNGGNNVLLINQKETTKFNNSITLNTENYAGAYKATELLIANGHRKIAHISGEIKKLSSRERYRGYCQCLKDFNIRINKNYIIESHMHRQDSGYEAMKEIIKNNENDLPTAVFACNDLIAVGAMKAIVEAGIKIPEEISIVGYDNVEISKYTIPPLTTISTNVRELTELSIELLVDSIENKKIVNRENLYKQFEVIQRNSIYKI